MNLWSYISINLYILIQNIDLYHMFSKNHFQIELECTTTKREIKFKFEEAMKETSENLL